MRSGCQTLWDRELFGQDCRGGGLERLSGTMRHPADFVDAHQRHLKDAELLIGRARWANADQMYGFSAECGLKAIMKVLGMPVDASGKPREREHQKHVQDLWPVFSAFATGRGGARYLRLLPGGEPFSDWSHHNRYAHRRHFQEANVEPHRRATWDIRKMIQLARQDGQL